MLLAALFTMGCQEKKEPYRPQVVIGSLGTPPVNEIHFTTTDELSLIALDEEAFDKTVIGVFYTGLSGRILFDGELSEVGDEAFANCTNLLNISLPHSVRTIGTRAFYNCTNMQCMTLGGGLRSCEAEAFDGCYSLYTLHITSIAAWCSVEFATPTSNPAYYSQGFCIDGVKVNAIKLPNDITSIGKYAFINNIYIQKVDIPRSLTSIGESAFEEALYLSSVNINDIGAWCAIHFENESANPLSIATTLTLEDMPYTDVVLEGVESISSLAFINCTSISSITADDSLKTIGNKAFRNCTSLTSLTLGNGVSHLGEQAFMNCKELLRVECHATTPPTLADNYTFAYNNPRREIYVPAESLKSYRSVWSQYATAILALQQTEQ